MLKLTAVTVWMLVAASGHGAIVVPDLPTREECERVYKLLESLSFAYEKTFGPSHACIQYQRSAQ